MSPWWVWSPWDLRVDIKNTQSVNMALYMAHPSLVLLMCWYYSPCCSCLQLSPPCPWPVTQRHLSGKEKLKLCFDSHTKLSYILRWSRLLHTWVIWSAFMVFLEHDIHGSLYGKEQHEMFLFVLLGRKERFKSICDRVDDERIFSFEWTFPFGSFPNEMRIHVSVY